MPGFVRLLELVPEEGRTGYLFNPAMRRKLPKQRRYQDRQVGRVISKIGESAGVIVNDQGKFASAHDTRRGSADGQRRYPAP